MLTLVPDAIEKYASRHSSQESNLLRALTKETYAKAKLPQMLIGHVEGNFLRMLVRMIHARRVLEIGTFTGYSALSMAEGLSQGGQLVTLDIDQKSTAMARKYWAKSPHGKKIILKLGPALRTIKTLKGSFDLVFVDADKENYIRYWKSCLPLVRRGGLIVVDNVLWSGRVLNPKSETDKAVANFNRYVQRDKRVDNVMLTVRDGITVSIKK